MKEKIRTIVESVISFLQKGIEVYRHNEKVKKALNLFGKILSIATLLYMGYKVYDMLSKNEITIYWSRLALPFVLFILLYVVCVYANSISYYFILKDYFRTKIAYEDILGIYIKSNIYKYLPTNTMHYVGRVVLAEKYETSKKKIFLSSAYEIGNTVVSTLIFCGVFFLSGRGYGYIAVPLVLLLFFPLRKFKMEKPFFINAFVILAGNLIVVLLFNELIFGFFALQRFSDIAFSQSLSFLIGMLTPGAPGGLGIREAVMVALSSKDIRDGITMAILLFRIVTILGDFLAYFILPGVKTVKKRFTPAYINHSGE